jgi:hemerythrin-like domain-containing protein
MPFRRDLLLGAALIAAAPKKTEAEDEDVSPAEDLMREHGLLNRLLLVYEECARRMDGGEAPPPQLGQSANIIRDFVEGYHEKLEEEFLFPRFRKANTLADLADTLQRQHEAGRKITAAVLEKPTPQLLRAFVRMYRPHEAREDTILFPAFRKLVGKKEYGRLGDRFEEREHQLFGKSGFEGQVENVAAIERALGIYELDQFTPR